MTPLNITDHVVIHVQKISDDGKVSGFEVHTTCQGIEYATQLAEHYANTGKHPRVMAVIKAPHRYPYYNNYELLYITVPQVPQSVKEKLVRLVRTVRIKLLRERLRTLSNIDQE